MSATLNVESRSLFHGDNLPFLRAINSDSIHLIATDPPFNKNRDFHATPDSLASGASFQDRWSWDDVEQEWVDQITDDFPKLMEAVESARCAHSDGMGAYMCYMAVRLLEMKRVLRPGGSVYLHCDQTASHYLKAIMDAIFGWKNFRNEIVWQRTITRKGNLKRGLAADSDAIFRYSKGDTFTWNAEAVTIPYDLSELDEKTRRKYSQKDENGRLYQLTAINAPEQDQKSKCTYEVMGVTRTWRWSKERMEKEMAAGRIVQTKPGNVPRQIRYLDEQKGKTLNNVWTDISTINSQAKERMGYPTQKPLALYERIIRASSNEGDVVLDPFCGCATTLVAAERLGRRWIGMDIWDRAHETVIRRLQDENLTSPDGDMGGRLFTAGQITYAKEPPERTDEGEEAVPFLKTKLRKDEPRDRKMSRKEMVEYLLDQYGSKCRGCDRTFDDPRYLELDHNAPRSSGGINHISNRILLCGPCNKLKSNIYTLDGLRKENKKLGYMAK